MPAERAPMRKIREVLRLKHACGLSERRIALAIGLSRSTIKAYLKRAESCGIVWPLPPEIEDSALERQLFPTIEVARDVARPLPEWREVQRELKRRGVTLQLLWEEYRAHHHDGYGYSRFCDLYRAWLKTVSPTMRQTHAAGEKLFVDWAGDTVPVFDALMGEERRAHIFVAVLGASNYIYAEARWSEGLPDWIGAHVNAFAAIRGVPGAVVCDNLKAGVTTTCRYEPGINRTYLDLATHYDTAILPTRPRKPRDKAKVEVGVLIVERYVLARLRKKRFFSLVELNSAIREIVVDLNARIMRKLGVSRIELLETIERPELKGLPSEPYQYAEWKKCRVAPDYHIEVDHHYYSVPSRLIRQEVEARITDTTIEILHKGSRVASHVRSRLRNRHTTIQQHMPSAHRRYAEWTPSRMMRHAASIGPATIALVEAIMKAKPHPEQGFRACLGIVRLARSYGPARLEAACRRGNEIGAHTYGSIASILKNGLDKAYAREPTPEAPPVRHGNIRGTGYYH
jgi:transposase